MRARTLPLLLLVLVACGANARKDTLQTMYKATTVAEGGFVAWDAAHQHDIVQHATSREDGEAKLAAYRASRDPVEQALIAAYRTIATAMFFDNHETLAGAQLAWTTLAAALKQVTGRTWP